MSQRRELNLPDADAVAAEVHRLRGGYTKTGNWTLPQMCHHFTVALTHGMRPGPFDPVTPDPASRAMLDRVLTSGRIPDGRQAPERAIPPHDASDVAIDGFLMTLEKFKSFTGPCGPHPLFGPLTLEEFKRVHLIHITHHLSFLLPA